MCYYHADNRSLRQQMGHVQTPVVSHHLGRDLLIHIASLPTQKLGQHYSISVDIEA